MKNSIIIVGIMFLFCLFSCNKPVYKTRKGKIKAKYYNGLYNGNKGDISHYGRKIYRKKK